MPQWVNAWLFLVLWAFFDKNWDIFMATICDMAMERLADTVKADISLESFMIE